MNNVLVDLQKEVDLRVRNELVKFLSSYVLKKTNTCGFLKRIGDFIKKKKEFAKTKEPIGIRIWDKHHNTAKRNLHSAYIKLQRGIVSGYSPCLNCEKCYEFIDEFGINSGSNEETGRVWARLAGYGD